MIGRLCRLVAVLGLFGGLVFAQAASAGDIWQAWLQNLASAGYTVTSGSALLSSVHACLKVVVPIFNTCFDSDASDPYVVPLVPVGQGYVDPYFGVFGSHTLHDGTVTGDAFRLGANDAVLVIVNMPPDAGYFSYQNYVFTRLRSLYAAGHAGTVSPDPARFERYATYGNSTNNSQIFSQAGFSFGGGKVAIFSTANASLVTDMTSRFVAVGGAPSLLFPDPIGSNASVGLSSSADDFSILLRYLVPANPSLSQTWLSHAAENVRVYRISGPTGLAVTPYPRDTLRNRGYNANETIYAADLSELAGIMKSWLATKQSGSAITVKQVAPSMQASATGQPLSGDIGDLCIAHARLCNGDSQDTIYWAGFVGRVPAKNLFVAEGVNPAVTNNTTVLSLNLEDVSRHTGLAALSQINISAAGFNNNGVLDGSAALALQTLGLWNQASPQLQQDSPNLYVHIFTRSCGAGQNYCNDSFVTKIPLNSIPYTDSILFYQRTYALPGSQAGPNPYYVESPYIIY